MTYKLGKNIQSGQKIKTSNGWRKVKEVTEFGVILSDSIVKFGDIIYGWKIK